MNRFKLRLTALGTFVSALLGAACASTFDPSNEVKSVRVLAVRADKPYAAPGDSVRLDMLAFDGRADKKTPMTVSWFPEVCINPASDAYYGCYARYAARLHAGVDLTPALSKGTSFSFTVPSNIITSHAPAQSGPAYGVAVVLGMACAGHVEYLAPPEGGPPEALPFGCFDANHAQLGADDYVFTFAVVYAFASETNANPTLSNLTYAGASVDTKAGITVARCTASNLDDCPKALVDTVVPASSQESTPDDGVREEIWVDYYVSGGKLKNDTVILYDPKKGALSGTGDDLYAPQSAGDFTLWAVVHDDRGGVSWTSVPFHVR